MDKETKAQKVGKSNCTSHSHFEWRGSIVYWIWQTAHDQEVVGSNTGAGKLHGCYVDCFTQHNPPVTLELRVKQSRWVREVKKYQPTNEESIILAEEMSNQCASQEIN